MIIVPRMQPVDLRWDYRNHAQIEHQLPGFITLVSAIHQQRKAIRHRPQFFQQGPAMWCVVIVAGGERKGYSRSSIRGNHMNLWFHPPRDFPMACGPFFFKAPVPSGWTFTEVESSENASIL